MDLAGSLGRVDMNFFMHDDLIDALGTVYADASNHKCFISVLKEEPITNSIDEMITTARQYNEKESQKWFCFSVTDSGQGMEPEQLGELFHSDDDEGEGNAGAVKSIRSRLRVVVCAELCRRLGGFLACVSTPYEGTVFHIGIPVETPVDGVVDAHLNQPKESRRPIIVSGPILVVGGDDSIIDDQLRSECEKLHLNVDIIKLGDGRAAVSAFCREITPSVMFVGTCNEEPWIRRLFW